MAAAAEDSRQVRAARRARLDGAPAATTTRRQATMLQRSGSPRRRNAARARQAPDRRRPETRAAEVRRVLSPDMTSRTVALNPSRRQHQTQLLR